MTAPEGFASSPEPWRRHRRRDRLSPRRSPLSLSAGGFVAIRRQVERAGRADPLLLRHAGRRLGGVSSTRGNSRPAGSRHRPPRPLGGRYRRNPVASTGPASGNTDRRARTPGRHASRPPGGIANTRTASPCHRRHCNPARPTDGASTAASNPAPTGTGRSSRCLAAVRTSSAGPRPSTAVRARTSSPGSDISSRMSPASNASTLQPRHRQSQIPASQWRRTVALAHSKLTDKRGVSQISQATSVMFTKTLRALCLVAIALEPESARKGPVSPPRLPDSSRCRGSHSHSTRTRQAESTCLVRAR